MDQSKIDAFNEKQKLLAEENAKTQDTAFALKSILDSQENTQKAIRQTLQGVVKFLNSYQPKVSLTNPQELPDIQPVIDSVTRLLKETDKKQADFTKVVEGLNTVATNLAKLPTKYPETKIPQPIDYTKKFDELKGALKPPIVNVPKLPEIKIPDYSKELKDLLSAVNKIKIPEIPKSDGQSVVKAIKDLQRFIAGLSIPASAGGGGSSGPQNLQFDDTEVTAANPLPVDVTGGITLDPGDIEIGAVEIKNGADDTRATVTAANALKVDGSAVTQPVSGTVSVSEPVTVDGTVALSQTGNDNNVDANITNATIAVTQSGTWDEVGINDSGNSITVDAVNLDIRDLTFVADKVDASGTVLGAGNNNIGDVDIVTLPGDVEADIDQLRDNSDLMVPDIDAIRVATQSIDGKFTDMSGTWGYVSDISGTETLSGSKRVIGITAVSTAGGTITINGGDTITLPANSSFKMAPQANLVDPTIIFTATNSYVVEYLA